MRVWVPLKALTTLSQSRQGFYILRGKMTPRNEHPATGFKKNNTTPSTSVPRPERQIFSRALSLAGTWSRRKPWRVQASNRLPQLLEQSRTPCETRA